MAAVVIASNMSCRGYLRPHLNWAWLFQPPWLSPAAVYVYTAFCIVVDIPDMFTPLCKIFQ